MYIKLFVSLLCVLATVQAQYTLIATYAGGVYSGCDHHLGDALNSSLPLLRDVYYAADGTGYYASLDCRIILRQDPTTKFVSIFAGNMMWDNYGDGGQATSAAFRDPTRVQTDPTNTNLYVCGPGYIRKINIASRIVSLYAGDYTAYGDGDIQSGDGGPATSAAINCAGMWVNATGHVIFSDGQSRLRVINPGGNHQIQPYAGTSTVDYANGNRLTVARFDTPTDLWADNLYLYVAEQHNCRVRKIHLVQGTVSNYAGTGTCASSGELVQATAASFNGIEICGKDTNGNMFMMDVGNNAIRLIDTIGIVSLFAGGNGGYFNGDWIQATSAAFSISEGGCAMKGGVLYFSETDYRHTGQNSRVRVIYDDVNYPTMYPIAPPSKSPTIKPTKVPTSQPAPPTAAPQFNECCANCRNDITYHYETVGTEVEVTTHADCGAQVIVTTHTTVITTDVWEYL